jgi:aryl-alcohol dehydrogenase-like predicted oxidoreductase
LYRARAQRIQELARRRGLSTTQVVLGYLMGQPFVTVPIAGCQSPAQLADSLSAGDVQLGADEIAYLVEGTPLDAEAN